MGHKIFVSYKYWDNNVAPLWGYSNNGYAIPRHYVSYIDDVISRNYGHVFKGEDDREDLRYLKEDTIWAKLRDRIYDSTLTIVLISPSMKDMYVPEINQWIPWEISFSLRETTRKDRTSGTNAMLAVILPDGNRSYDYFVTTNANGTFSYKTDKLFSILKNNMFNEVSPNIKYVGNEEVYYGYYSYIHCVKWCDFVQDMDRYINTAYEIKKNKNRYVISTKIGI